MKPINFDKLISNYKFELNTKLRGFNEDLDYLKFWVPGTDDFTSLVNLIDALFENNNYQFSVIFRKDQNTLVEKINQMSSQIGDLKILKNTDFIRIDFKINPKKYKVEEKKKIEKIKKDNIFKHENINEILPKAEVYDILPEYLENIEKHSIKNFKEKTTSEEKNSVLLNVKIFNEYLFFVNIDKNNKIISAWHNNSKKDYVAKLIDLFCEFLHEKGIQEASEHSVIYLENYLRPDEMNKKINGILLPRKVGKIFFIFETSIREIFKKYKQKTNYMEKINKDYFNAHINWISKNEKEKIFALDNILNKKILPSLKISSKDVSVAKIELDNKVILNISDNFKKMNEKRENLLIKIENNIKKYIDRRLEIFILPKKDENKLRLTNAPKE